jgi:chromosome segregation ATPase
MASRNGCTVVYIKQESLDSMKKRLKGK